MLGRPENELPVFTKAYANENWVFQENK